MRGTDGVAPHLLHHLDLTDEGGFVDGGSEGAEVVVQTHALELARNAVELETAFLRHLDGADAEGLGDGVLDMAETEEIRQRVDRVRMQPLYLQCMRHKAESLRDGTWADLLRLMKKYKAMHREGHPQDRFIRDFEAAASARQQ